MECTSLSTRWHEVILTCAKLLQRLGKNDLKLDCISKWSQPAAPSKCKIVRGKDQGRRDCMLGSEGFYSCNGTAVMVRVSTAAMVR